MNRPASVHSETFLKPVALSDSESRRQPDILILRPSAAQFLETFEASLQQKSSQKQKTSDGEAPPAETQPALVHNLYGVGGVGKSTTLRDLANRVVQGNGNLARISFGETEQVETPIELMVTVFEALVAQNNWIFKPKFLVMHERYEKALQELATVPREGQTTVDETQQQAYQTLVGFATQSALLSPVEQSTAAAVAQAAAQEQVQDILHQHRATQHDQSLQTLLLEPLKIFTQAFAEALQKRAKRQPVVLMLDTYEKASLAIDAWLWHRLLPQAVLQDSGVRFAIASRSRLANQRGWKQLFDGSYVVSPVVPSDPLEPVSLPVVPTLAEQELDVFDVEETKTYLQRLAVSESRTVSSGAAIAHVSAEEAFAITEGRPYGLQEMARQRLTPASVPSPGAEAASTPTTSATTPSAATASAPSDNAAAESIPSEENGNANGHETNGTPKPLKLPTDLAGLMQQELSLIQRYLVGLAACCRSFTQDLIDYLLLAQDANFALAVEAECNGFEWLIQQPYVEKVQGCWRLDDVARNVFRQAFLETDEKLFFKVQEQLADYFLARSNEAVAPEASPQQKYQHPIWQRGRAEYLYYLLLSHHPEAQQELRSLLLEGHYFNQELIVQEAFKALLSEFPLAEHALLDEETRSFLQRIEPVVTFGDTLLNRANIPYEFLEGTLGVDEETADMAVQACLEPNEELEGLAKFTALFYESKQCLAGEQLSYLEQAQAAAETVVTEADPDFSSDLFLWKLGDRYSSLGEYEAAIAAYDRALTFTPMNAAAWDNRGSSLGCLGRLEEAIISFDKALELNGESHDLWHSRGLALAKSERYQEAIQSFDQALEIKPEKHEPWYDKACCYALQKMPTLALESLEKAIALNGDYRQMAVQDGDLAILREDEEFKRMIAA